MNSQKSNNIRSFTIVILMTFTLNSYASNCDDTFNNEDSSLPQIEQIGLNSINVGKNILKTMRSFFEHLVQTMPDSNDGDPIEVKYIKMQQLDGVKNFINFADQITENLNNASTLMKEKLSQSNDPENDASLLIPLTNIKDILETQVEPFKQLFIQQEYPPDATHITTKDIELLQRTQQDLENKGIKLTIQIKKIEDKIIHLQTKNNFSRSNVIPIKEFADKNNENNVVPIKEFADENNEDNTLTQNILHTMRIDANELTEQLTAIRTDSSDFDTFTRDSILLLLLKHTKDGYKQYLEKERILSKETDKMIIHIRSSLTNTSTPLKIHNDIMETALLNQTKLEKIKTRLDNAIVFMENFIQTIDTELKNPINNGKKRDRRVDNAKIKIIFDLRFLPAITKTLEDMVQIEVDNALIEAKLFAKNNS